MRTIKLFAIVLVICTAGCMDSEAVRSVLSGTPLSSADNRSDELTVGDVNKPQRDPNEPTATSEGGSQQAMPAAGFIQAQVRNTSGRSAKVSIRFLMNDLEVHFTRLRVRSQRETFMIGPELAQIIEFSGTDATGATLPPAIFVFGDNVDEDNPAIYVIADSGEQEPEQPIDDPQEDQDDQQTPDQPDEEESTEPEEEEEEEEEEPASPPGGGGGGQQPPPITDCNQNGVPDEHDILHGTSQDCNSNAVPDECDIAAGTSSDVNGNAVPDECEPDCNTNGVPDYLDILHGTSQNCNANSVPDECDIQAGTSTDVNGNAVPDECEPDCNANGVPDDLDIQCGTSHDCNTNSIPDECDIAAGTSVDANSDGIPDECVTGPGTLWAVDLFTADLYTIDTDNGDITLKANMAPDVERAMGLSFDPSSRYIYAVVVNTSGIQTLIKINPGTSAVEHSVAIGGDKPISDISFGANGILYGVLSEDTEDPAEIGRIVLIDVNDGALTLTPHIGAGGIGQSIAVKPATNSLYHTACPDGYLLLEMLDLDTGNWEHITYLSHSYQALAYGEFDDWLLGASSSRQGRCNSIYTISAEGEGLLTTIGDYAPAGMTFVPDPSE